MLLGIFVLSSIPSDKLPQMEFSFEDKLIHIGLFSALFLCFVWSLKHQKRFSILAKNYLVSSLILTVLYGMLDEFHQSFVPNRTRDVYDWLADSAGALLTFLILIFSSYKTRKNKYL